MTFEGAVFFGFGGSGEVEVVPGFCFGAVLVKFFARGGGLNEVD